jgi:DNA segregation ATPase FtsK/SpoIIIE, S-DNA-T family
MTLPFTVGTAAGQPVTADLAALPHLLIAGTTGSGKSVFMRSLLADLLDTDTLLLLIDPKRVEFAAYRNSPQLVTRPLVDPEQAEAALLWLRNEMEERYRLLEGRGLLNIDSTDMPRIVAVVDELANLILLHPRVEKPLVALASMGRAAGIHLVLATQRPSADVLTGLLRANIPARVAMTVATQMESRIILDEPGAEKLNGRGDLLFRVGNKVTRLQGRMA